MSSYTGSLKSPPHSTLPTVISLHRIDQRYCDDVSPYKGQTGTDQDTVLASSPWRWWALLVFSIISMVQNLGFIIFATVLDATKVRSPPSPFHQAQPSSGNRMGTPSSPRLSHHQLVPPIFLQGVAEVVVVPPAISVHALLPTLSHACLLSLSYLTAHCALLTPGFQTHVIPANNTARPIIA